MTKERPLGAAVEHIKDEAVVVSDILNGNHDMLAGTVSRDNVESVHININGSDLDLPVVTGTQGERGIDISSLRDKTGFITLDEGYGNTGACTSAIT